MIAKFLFGTERVIPLDLEDTMENVQHKDMLYIVRKHDAFQHADMAKICRMHPSTGGFVKKIGRPGEEHFYGESISCRVQTDESMDELYHAITKEGEWFKYTYSIPGSGTKFTIFCGCPTGYKPSAYGMDFQWEPVKYEEIRSLMNKEVQENTSGFFTDW